ILRLFGLINHFDKYAKPMKEFLNKTMLRHKNADTQEVAQFSKKFASTAALIVETLGEKPFHLRGPLNLPALESVFVCAYGRPRKQVEKLGKNAETLFGNPKFIELSSVSTSDRAVIDERRALAEQVLFGE